jgi:8-oxo-dGTP diphosphatase
MGSEEQGVDDLTGQHVVVPRTLCFVTHADEVLLLRGAPDKRLWANRYNGVGGHVEPGEDVYAAARREVREETGLQVSDLQLRGILHVDVEGARAGVMIFVFTARAPDREVRPSGEGTPVWISPTEALELDLVEDLPVILPRVLALKEHEQPFSARSWYDEQGRLQVAFAAP